MSPTRESGVHAPMPFEFFPVLMEFVEQPSQEFRFRYLSEFKKGSHGCLKSDHGKRRKEGGGPVVRINYSGVIIVEVGLYTATEPRREHVHKLVRGSKTDVADGKIVFTHPAPKVTPNNSGWVHIELKNMNILHMGKDEVDKFLKDRWLKERKMTLAEFDAQTLKQKKQVEDELKEQKREFENNVVLGVKAFDAEGRSICGGMTCFSNKISNTKTVKKLNIEDISKVSGSCSGGDEVFILCDKIRLEDIDKLDPEKSDIAIEFYENCGENPWTAKARIVKIHHQAAMIFVTPPYKDTNLHEPLEVWMRLIRKSDKDTSDSRKFTYEPIHDDYELRRKRIKTFHSAGGNKPSNENKNNNNNFNRTIDLQDEAAAAAADSLLKLSRSGTPNVIDEENLTNLPDSKIDVELLISVLNGDVDFNDLDLQGIEDDAQLQDEEVEQFVVNQVMPAIVNPQQSDTIPVLHLEESDLNQPSTSTSSQHPQYFELTPMNPSNAMPQLVEQQPFQFPHDVIATIPEFQTGNQKQMSNVFTEIFPGPPLLQDMNRWNPSADEMENDDISEFLDFPSSRPYIRNDGMFSGQQEDVVFETDSDRKIVTAEERMAEISLRSDRKIATIEEHMADLSLSNDNDEYKRTGQSSKNKMTQTGDSTITPEKKLSSSSKDKVLAYKLALHTAQCLHSYARTGNVNILLMSMRHLIALQDEHGDNAIHASVLNSQVHALKSLLEVARTIAEYDVLNMCNGFNQSPLHIAVQMKQDKMVSLLLYYGTNPNRVDRNGNMAIHLAAQQGTDNCLNAILNTIEYTIKYKNHEPKLDAHNYAGFTPLHLAVLRNSYDNVNRLCFAGCNVNLHDYTSGRSALHMAVEKQNAKIVAYLLQTCKAETDVHMFNGNTPLHLAVMQDNLEIVKLLMAANADPYLENNESDWLEEEAESSEDNQSVLCRGLSPWDLARSREVRCCIKREPVFPLSIYEERKPVQATQPLPQTQSSFEPEPELTVTDREPNKAYKEPPEQQDSGIGLSAMSGSSSFSVDGDHHTDYDKSKQTLADLLDCNVIEKLSKSLDKSHWQKVLELMDKADIIEVLREEQSPTRSMLQCLSVNDKDILATCLEVLDLEEDLRIYKTAVSHSSNYANRGCSGSETHS